MMKPDEQLVEQAKMVLDFNCYGEYTLISPSNLETRLTVGVPVWHLA
jgi:hypothetical protein